MKQILITLAALLLSPLAALHADAATNFIFHATISPVSDKHHGQWGVALAELSPGRVIAVWEAGHTEVGTPNSTLAAESRDGGRTWSTWREFQRSTGVRSVPCGFYRIKDTTHCLIMEYPMAGGAQPCRALDLATSDGGATWSQPREFWRTKAGVVMRPVVLRDGRIALPVYQSVAGHDGKTTSLASVLVSKDDGATWQMGSAIPCDLPGGAMEPTLAETADGGWLCIIRTRGTGALLASRSQDSGQTWEVAAPLPLESPESIACLIRLADGSHLVAWNGIASKTQGPRNRLTVARSLDGGRTWPQRRDLLRTNDGNCFSNHGVLQLADGRILVGYQHLHSDPESARQGSVDSVDLASFDLRWLTTDPSLAAVDGTRIVGGKSNWRNALVLDRERQVVSGSTDALAAAIRRGADLRIYTEFRHNEHIDTKSTNRELIKEVADFRITYLLEDRWVAGVINLRQPIELPNGFGPRPSMSFFLYNQNADQAIARPYLDDGPATGKMGPAPGDDHSDMPKYHQFDAWDTGTNAPSSNFAYDFDTYKFMVCDDWQEVYACDADGKVLSGSIDALAADFAQGREVKVGIGGLCADITAAAAHSMPHEVFVQCGSCYYYTERKQFMAASQPVVRVRPAIPLRYKSKEWDFGWLMPRSDGHVARWLLDPYTLKFNRSESRHAIRWFVR